jgi:phosphoribosylglycinamide formyltransferase-1
MSAAESAMSTPMPGRIGVLISGRGSNLRAIIDAIGQGRLNADIRLVISNRPDAEGLNHARAAGLETLVLPHGQFASRALYDDALVSALASRDVRLVCLAGFMRVLGPRFCAAFPDAVLNIHPSLLPSFPGAHAQRQALVHGVKVSGATVHFVTSDLDDGPIVAQEAVPVLEGDSEQTLSERILEVEHRLYPLSVARVLAGGWRISGRRVIFDTRDDVVAPGPARM